MEAQVKVNGQVIILADTKPLYHHGYDQWRLIKTETLGMLMVVEHGFATMQIYLKHKEK